MLVLLLGVRWTYKKKGENYNNNLFIDCINKYDVKNQ